VKKLAIALLLLSSVARAEQPPLRLDVFNALYGRVNPLGLEDWLIVGLMQRLYPARHIALEDNWIYYGAVLRFSPSTFRVGPKVEIQPLSIFRVGFTAELIQWYGVFTTFQSFASPLDNWSDTTLYHLADAGLNYATTGMHLAIQPTLQFAYGPIVFRDALSVDWFDARLRAGDTVFYEGTADTLVAPNGWTLQNDVYLMWRWPRLRLYAGALYTYVTPFYPASAYRPAEPHDNPNRQQRLHALGAWNFLHRPTARVKEMSLIGIVGWYIDHRYRTGADVNAGVPYILGSFAIETDWPQ
jgi:hypothetical protein